MPTKRTPISRFSTALNRAQRCFLYDEPLPDDAGPLEFTEFCALTCRDEMPLIGRPTARELWTIYRDEVLRAWRRDYPGSRPAGWWRFNSPGPRQRIGGSGEPGNADMHLGIPSYWSRPVPGDRHGERELSFDPADAPVYESQAQYLHRHRLLTPAERRRLTDADFAPERIAVADDD